MTLETRWRLPRFHSIFFCRNFCSGVSNRFVSPQIAREISFFEFYSCTLRSTGSIGTSFILFFFSIYALATRSDSKRFQFLLPSSWVNTVQIWRFKWILLWRFEAISGDSCRHYFWRFEAINLNQVVEKLYKLDKLSSGRKV